MALTTFDTHKFVRRLEQAGMPLELADLQAETLTEAFTVNLESLVTNNHLDSRLDARFAEQKAGVDSRFAEQKTYIDTRFAEQKACMDTRFAGLEARLSGKIDSNHRIFLFTQAIIIAAIVLPQLQRLSAL